MTTPRPSHGGNLVWAAELANCSPDAILDFSASINPLGPPESAIVAIQSSLKNLVAYPDPHYTQLRTALSQFHSIPADWILPGNGAAELLTWACRELAELATVILPTPAFSDYIRALKAFNARIKPVSLMSREATLEAFTLDVKELTQLFSTAHAPLPASLVGLLLNNPHNPSGQIFSKNSILALLDQFALVVVDEAFMDFLIPTEQQSVMEWVQKFPNLVVIRSLTKFYSLPGLRLGYAIAHPDRLRRWQAWRDPWSINSLAAAVGEVVLQDTDFQQRTWDWLATARPVQFDELAQLPELSPYPSAANFLLIHSERSVPSLQAELLKRHQILIRDCLSFPELGDRYFRIAIRTPEDNRRLIQGLKDVLQE